MTDDFQMQKRYFTSQLEDFKQRPELHRARIRDCRHYLQMLEEAGGPGEFKRKVQQSGNMLSSAKAEALDRYRNRARIYEALGQERKASEERMRMEAVEAAESHNGLSTALQELEETTDLGFCENKAMNALGPMMTALFHLCTDMPGSEDERRSLATFREYWKQFAEADPEASWERISTYVAYRDRLIFSEGQMEFLERKFREVCNG